MEETKRAEALATLIFFKLLMNRDGMEIDEQCEEEELLKRFAAGTHSREDYTLINMRFNQMLARLSLQLDLLTECVDMFDKSPEE